MFHLAVIGPLTLRPDARLSKSIALAHSFPALCTAPHVCSFHRHCSLVDCLFSYSACLTYSSGNGEWVSCVLGYYMKAWAQGLFEVALEDCGGRVEKPKPNPFLAHVVGIVHGLACIPLTVPSSSGYSELPCEGYHQSKDGSDCRLGLAVRPCSFLICWWQDGWSVLSFKGGHF